MNRQSTLCYIEKDGKYLMLHRVVKKNDVNKDKWIGVGGHFEYAESPEECTKEKGITVIMSLHEIDLAQKISDKIICVKGDAISHFGAPETIFREDIIRELYEIDNGSFDPCFGSIELPRPEGTPRVFVLAGGGTGIPVFRKLQKENVPFAAGVLYTNDIDYQLARILAMETVTEAPFQEISDEAFARACELMKSCERVIDTGVPVGMCNRRIEELRAEAKRLGKLAE